LNRAETLAVAALKLYCELQEMAPFIKRYRTGKPHLEGK